MGWDGFRIRLRLRLGCLRVEVWLMEKSGWDDAELDSG